MYDEYLEKSELGYIKQYYQVSVQHSDSGHFNNNKTFSFNVMKFVF